MTSPYALAPVRADLARADTGNRSADARARRPQAPARRRANLLVGLSVGALLFLGLGRAIGDASGDPLLGLIGASLVVATLAALVASPRRPRSRHRAR